VEGMCEGEVQAVKLWTNNNIWTDRWRPAKGQVSVCGGGGVTRHYTRALNPAHTTSTLPPGVHT
jgi:hypothetical protein